MNVRDVRVGTSTDPLGTARPSLREPSSGEDMPSPQQDSQRQAGPEVQRYAVRAATPADVDVLAYQRRAMFVATGLLAPEDADELEAAVRGYVERAMPAGTFHAWLAESDGVVVAGGGIQLRTLMPRPGYVGGEPEALVVSMWTEPEHRRRGLGRRVLTAMLAWCRARGIRRLTLHASHDGRPLYETFGFATTNEMRLELPADDQPDLSA